MISLMACACSAFTKQLNNHKETMHCKFSIKAFNNVFWWWWVYILVFIFFSLFCIFQEGTPP